MTTPTQFQHKLSELDLNPLAQPLTKSTRPTLEQLQNQLHQIEQDINREIHVIRTQYQSRIDAANQGGSSRVLVSNRQASSGRHRADQVTRLETELEDKLAPYLDVKSKTEDLLGKVETALVGAKK